MYVKVKEESHRRMCMAQEYERVGMLCTNLIDKTIDNNGRFAPVITQLGFKFTDKLTVSRLYQHRRHVSPNIITLQGFPSSR